jgi:antitoxin component of MazEF toxin-antitoxin module
MNKAILATLVALASQSAFAADNGNGRLSGKAGAAWATGDFVDGALLNPSLAANFKAEDDFALNLNLGAFATDPDDLIKNVDDLDDLLDKYEGYGYNGTGDYRTSLDSDDAEKINELLQDIDGSAAYVEGGASIAVAIPNQVLAATAFARASLTGSFIPNISDSDFTLIENSVDAPFSSDELTSEVTTVGALVTEYGVALGKRLSWREEGDLLVGVTPKMVDVETFYYRDNVNDFDVDEIEDNHEDYTYSSDFFSLDAGATYLKGPMSYALVLNNIIGKDVKTVVEGETLSIKPQAVAAVGYDIEWFNAEAALDLMPAENFALHDDVQQLRVGAEFGANYWAQLRLGYKTDLEGTLEDTYSIGVGLSPFNVVNLDIALTAGDKNTYGGALQLGMRF